jgi:hypothetical protein
VNWDVKVNNNSAMSVDPSGPHINIDGHQISIGIAILASVLQIVTSFLQVSGEIKTALFLVVLLIGLGAILWVMHRWPKNSLPLVVFVFGTLVALGVLLWGNKSEASALPNTVTPQIHYIRVLAFAIDASDGEIEGDRPLTNVTVMTRDQYGHVAIYKTGVHGTQSIPVESPESIATVTIGACGIFQTHHISSESHSAAEAQIVQVGIAPAILDACPK